MAPFTNVLATTISILYLTVAILALGKDNFRKECPPSRCSADGPVVRFPFRLNLSAPHCGYYNFLLYCSHGNTVLRLPLSGEYNVTSIDYLNQHLTITRDSWSPCPWRRNIALPNDIGFFTTSESSCPTTNMGFPEAPNGTGSPFYTYYLYVAWLDCPTVITSISSPISCLGSEGRFVYVANDLMEISNMPTSCTVINRSIEFVDICHSDFKDGARPQARLYWSDYFINCSACEEKGHQCELNLETRKSFCSPRGD